MPYYTIQMHDGELYHHGILGQKWGKRNGPPYPLGASDHSSAEKKAGWRKSLDTYRGSVKRAKSERSERDKRIQKEYDKTEASIERKYKKGQNLSEKDQRKELAADTKARNDWKKSADRYSSDKKEARENLKKDIKSSINPETVKKAAKIGAAVAVTGLAAYGTYKLYGAAMSERYKMSPSKLRSMGIDVAKVSTAKPNSARFNTAYSNFTKSPSAYRQEIKDSFGPRSESAAKQYQNFSKAVDNGKVSALQILDNLDNIQTKRYKSDNSGYRYDPQARMQADLLSSLLESDYGAQSLITKGERESWKRH